MGGKGFVLERLKHAGVPVPLWVALTAGSERPTHDEVRGLLEEVIRTFGTTVPFAVRASVVPSGGGVVWGLEEESPAWLGVDVGGLAEAVTGVFDAACSGWAGLERAARGEGERVKVAVIVSVSDCVPPPCSVVVMVMVAEVASASG